MEPKEIKEILIKRNIEKSDDSLKIAELIIRENRLRKPSTGSQYMMRFILCIYVLFSFR